MQSSCGPAGKRLFIWSWFLGPRRAVFLTLSASAIMVACAPRASVSDTPTPLPDRVVAESLALPPIPLVRGPVDVRVVYPPAGTSITARDSNFIFGSVGSGDARLRINGTEVRVHPNGAFLGWLPVPRPDSAEHGGRGATYVLEATQGVDTVRLLHRIVLPPSRPMLRAGGPLIVDSTSVAPRGRSVWMPNDDIRVSVRALSNAEVMLQTPDGRERPLIATVGALVPRRGEARAPRGDEDQYATAVPAHVLRNGATLVVRALGQTARLPVPAIGLADSAGVGYAVVGAGPSTLPDSERTVSVRPVPGGTYKWFLLPGTVVAVTARTGEFARIQLAPELEGWVEATELSSLPVGYAPSPRIAGNARVVPGPTGEWSDVVIPMAAIPAYDVDESHRQLRLTLLGTQGNSDIIRFVSGDSVIERVTWQQVETGRVRYDISLRHSAYGYHVRWTGREFVVRVRRPPRVDRTRPLAGLTIAVDPGHPPAGTTGPTGLYEAVPALAVANRVRTYLEQAGATVVMTRSAPGAVALGDRPVIARRANAHAFVSIHFNALPDGVNPFTAQGTGTYYFTPRSEPLARAVQAGMVRRMGLRDLAIYYDNLAVVRQTWMPSVLCEGAFLMIPEQEAASKTAVFQDRYARGVVDGLSEYFSSLNR